MCNDPSVRNIVVSGYPKSGNTWVTRLVAEILGCPVAGFFGSHQAEIAVEGFERKSKMRCYKSHHQWTELKELGVPKNDIIYVVRDPRDVAVSGAHFFKPDRLGWASRTLGSRRTLIRIYRGTLYHLWNPPRYRLKRVIDGILKGDGDVNHWCRVPWKQHVLPFVESGVCVVRYEAMLEHAGDTCVRLADHLGVRRSIDEIRRAVERQSFGRRKADFSAKGLRRQARFLRSGRSGEWREALTESQKARFRGEIGEELLRLGYEL